MGPSDRQPFSSADREDKHKLLKMSYTEGDSIYQLNEQHWQTRYEDHFQRPTYPFDARFPNQNVQKVCWQNFFDYHRCLKQKGEDHEPCKYFQRSYTALCTPQERDFYRKLYQKE